MSIFAWRINNQLSQLSMPLRYPGAIWTFMHSPEFPLLFAFLGWFRNNNGECNRHPNCSSLTSLGSICINNQGIVIKEIFVNPRRDTLQTLPLDASMQHPMCRMLVLRAWLVAGTGLSINNTRVSSLKVMLENIFSKYTVHIRIYKKYIVIYQLRIQ